MESTLGPPQSTPDSAAGAAESLEGMQARHRKQLRDLQNRITSKKKNATKRTRKGVNDECANLERDLREKQAAEIATLDDNEKPPDDDPNDAPEPDHAANGLDDDNANVLAASLAATSVADPPDKQQQQEPGKKRNRQQERLTRRAAEREAAMVAAEEEAANMVDKRQIESTYMKEQMEQHGLVEEQIRPDGHCLFAAIADQLGDRGVSLGDGTEGLQQYKVVRKRAADYIERHADDFAPFLDVPVPKHAATIRDTAEWGGHVELLALARAYGVEIKVVQQQGRTESIGEGENALWLAFYRHGYGLGEHYNSLRVKS